MPRQPKFTSAELSKILKSADPPRMGTKERQLAREQGEMWQALTQLQVELNQLRAEVEQMQATLDRLDMAEEKST